jgi:alanine dehydrogenase
MGCLQQTLFNQKSDLQEQKLIFRNSFRKQTIIMIRVDKIRVLLLSEKEIAELLSIIEVMDVVENAFREKALVYAQMPSKVYLNFPKYCGDVRAMPAYLERLDVASVKIVNSHPENPNKFSMPTVSATVLLLNPKNGALLSIMGGNNITAMRTAAAGGLAAKYLAKKNSRTVGFIGAGVQARTQLLALNTLIDKLEVRVWSRTKEAKERFVAEMHPFCNNVDRMVAVEMIENAVRDADIVVTTTPSKTSLVSIDWIAPGTHINCIGADALGKQELDPAILKRAKIVVDDWEQASHSGEINVPFSKGVLSKKDVWAELGDIIAGIKQGRVANEEITVFDSTGLAIQDAATAELVYKKAASRKIGCFIDV